MQPTIAKGTRLPGCVVVAIKNDHIVIRRDSGEIARCEFDMAERLIKLEQK